MRHRFVLVFSLIVFGLSGLKAQVNLVPNPSFENIQSCPTAFSELDLALPWSQAGTGTPDLFSTCTSANEIGIPMNELGNQYPHTGNNYSGIFSFAQEYREYIEAPLTNSLIAGQKYFVSYFVSLADTIANTSSSIGAYFSTTSLSVNNYSPIPVSPQVQNAATNYFDYTSWKKVTGSFIALGGESYLTIGNFNSNANTNTLNINTNTVTYNNQAIYLYIDDVCVSTDSLYNEDWVGLIKKTNLENAAFIYPNPCNEYINIKSSDLIKELSLLDVYGKIKNTYTAPNSLNIKIDLKTFTDGIYYFKIRTDKTTYTKKIIINH